MRVRLFLLFLALWSTIYAQITASDNVTINNRKYIKIQTPSATYMFCKDGGGFSNIYDKDNKDWIGCYAGGCGYNGIPNLVYPADYFHLGRNNCTSTLTFQNASKAEITSRTKNGAWEVRWDIFETHATMHLLKKGPEKYWFLYEGTPYGAYNSKKDYWMSSDHSTRQVFGVSYAWKGDLTGLEWACFGDPDVSRVLFLLHHEQDNIEDTNWGDGCLPAGCGAMTVFGFGRAGNSYMMSAVPQTFSIGFLETTDYNTIKKRMEEIASGATLASPNRVSQTYPRPAFRATKNGLHLILPRSGQYQIELLRSDGSVIETFRISTAETAILLRQGKSGNAVHFLHLTGEGENYTMRLLY